MDILLRNIDYKTETQLNKLMAEYRNQGIKIITEKHVSKFIKKLYILILDSIN